MSKPNERKKKKRSQRKEKIKNQQHNAAIREQIEFNLFDAQSALQEGDFEAVARFCRSILNSLPEHQQALEMYSVALMNLQKYDTALPVYETLISLCPQSPLFSFNYVICLYRTKRFKELLEFTARLPSNLKFPREIREKLDSAIKLSRIQGAGADKRKNSSLNTTVSKISDAQKEHKVITDLQKIEISQSALKIDTVKFDSLLQHDNLTDPDGLFWLGFLLHKEHQKMQSEFEELLCIDHLYGINHFGYQTETVRKVFKVFHGRVLLSDEVGFG